MGLPLPTFFLARATSRHVALVFVFQPDYANDFEFRCVKDAHIRADRTLGKFIFPKSLIFPVVAQLQASPTSIFASASGRAWISTIHSRCFAWRAI